jgi:mannose-6-phosphate isomerase-like protein (cupin superfamily)
LEPIGGDRAAKRCSGQPRPGSQVRKIHPAEILRRSSCHNAAVPAKQQADMDQFSTTSLSSKPDAIAPDGSEVRLLSRTDRGSMAHFALAPHAVSRAVAHKTVEEVWYVLRGNGRMWRRLGTAETTVQLAPGTSIGIPTGAHFQFRNDGREPLEAIGVTMPPWPGADEAFEVPGIWEPSA